MKFNENVNSGIKSLFNLSLITLDNQELEILNIFKTVRNIKKISIQEYFSEEVNREILIKYIEQIGLENKTLLEGLLDYYLILPLPDNVTYQ